MEKNQNSEDDGESNLSQGGVNKRKGQSADSTKQHRIHKLRFSGF
jgi:hypothetical protein